MMPFLQEIDGIDAKILKGLAENARLKVSDISKKTGIPHATVRLRIYQLEKKRVIKGYRPILDYSKLGKPVKAFVDIKVGGRKRFEKIVEEYKKVQGLLELHSVSGSTDGVAVIIGKDISEINNILLKLRSVSDIVETNTKFVLKTLAEHGEFGP